MAQQQETLLRRICTIGADQAARDLPDEQLLARFVAAHDAGAFEALVRRHGPLVLGVCRRVLGDGPDAEDAFQATFLVLLRKAASIVRGERLSCWLYGVAHRIASRARVDAARRHRCEAKALARPSPDPLAELTARDLCAAIDAELNGLPQRYRAALLLCLLEGKTRDEAADLLGWSLATLKRRLQRGRELLRARLARRGLALPAALSATLLLGGTAGARVPASLLAATLDATQRWAGGAVTGRAALLAERLIHFGLLTRLKIATAALLLVASLAAGTLLSRQASLLVERARSATRAAAPAGPAFTDTSADPLPPGALVRLGTVRLRHHRDVFALACSPDGKVLASAGLGPQLILWDTATGRQEHRIRAHEGGIHTVAFSPDGSWLATAGADGNVRLWDARAVKVVRTLDRLGGPVASVTFSPDSKTLAAAGPDGVIRLWSTEGGDDPTLLKGHEGAVRSLAFAAGGKLLASAGSDRTVRIWRPDTGQELHRLAGHTAAVRAVTFTPAGETLASAGDDGSIRLWDARKGQFLRKLTGHTGAVRAVAFVSAGQVLASAGADGTLRLWDWRRGKEQKRLGTHTVEVQALAAGPGGKLLASGNADSSVRLWDPATGQEKLPLAGHRGWVGFVSFLSGGKTIVSASSHDRDVCLWDASTGRLRLRFPTHLTSSKAVAVSADGTRLATGKVGGGLNVWDLATGHPWAVALSPDGRLVAASEPAGALRVYEVASGKERCRLTGHTAMVRVLTFAPNGRTLISGSADRTIRVWDVPAGKQVRGWGDDHPVESLAVSPDGRLLASGGRSGPVRLWELATGQALRQSAERMGWIVGLAFSPDGKTLASGDGSALVRLWEVETMAPRGRFSGHGDGILGIAFAPDGRTVASASVDTTLLAWDVTGLRRGGLKPASAREFRALWETLGEGDAVPAYQAIWRLAAAPGAVKFLEQRLRSATVIDRERCARLVRDLDDDEFKVREKATQELLKMGDAGGPLLREALGKAASAEVRWRLDYLLEQLGKETPQRRRRLRAVEVLEHAGGAGARAVLAALAKGEPAARLTREAKEALGRLSKRGTTKHMKDTKRRAKKSESLAR